jgi:predicted outer membrane protein
VAQDAKPIDPQIAHIACTAVVIDIIAAKQAIDLVKKLKGAPTTTRPMLTIAP